MGTSLWRHRVHAASHYGFCGPVFIDEQGARRVLAPERYGLGPQLLTADDERSGPLRHLLWPQVQLQSLQVCRGELDQAVSGRCPQRAGERLGTRIVGKQLDCATDQEGCENARDGQVEGEGRMHRGACALGHLVSAYGPAQVIDQTSVRDAHTLWLSRGSGGVDDVGEVCRVGEARRGARGQMREPVPVGVQAHGGGAVARNVR